MSRHDNDNDIEVRGPSLPDFTTSAYYQALSQDERQYGEEAEYRQQFYNFIEQLHQQLYDAVANGDKIINRGDLYQPYPDNPQLQAQVNEFFDTLFPSNGSAIVENILSSDLFAGAVTEYNRASGNFDFAANWDSLSSPSQLQEQAQSATAENAGVYSTLIADIMGIPDNQKEAFIEWSNASLTGGNAREILEANPGLSNTIFNREGDQPTIYEAIGQLGDFEDFDATAVRENAERDIMGQLQGLSENVLNILFGSTNVEEILQQQLETAFPPSPSDPDYEQKFNEWIKRQSDSIISINHVPNAENPVFAGIRFPVPLPVSGPETIIPLFNQDGVYVGPGNLSEIFVGENGVLTQVKEGVSQTIGRLTENGAAIFGEDGTIAQVIDLGEAVIDELGNISYQPTDPNLMEGIDPETGLPTDDGGLPFDEEEEDEEEDEVSSDELMAGDSDLNGTEDVVDAEDIETEAYSGMFDNVPEDDRLAYLSDIRDAIDALNIPNPRTDKEIQDLIDAAIDALPADVVRSDDEINALITTALQDYIKTIDLPEDQVRTDAEIQALIDASLIEDTVRSDDEINDLIDTALEDYVKTADLPEDQVRTDDEINDLIDVALAAIPDDAVRTDDEIQDLINTALEDYVKTEDLPEDQVRTDDEINDLIGTALEDYVKTEDLPEDQVRTDDEIQDLINTTLEDYVKTQDLPEDQVRTDDEIQDLIDVALDAIPEDTVRSDDEINDLITTALDNLDLPEDTTRSDEEIQALIDSSISSFTTTDQVTNIVNNVLVQSGLTELNDLSETQVETIVNNIVGSPEDASGLYGFLANLNDLSEDDVTRIVTTALGGLENISSDDVSNIVTGIIGSPEDASGLYGAISDVSTQVSTLDTDLNNRIDALVDAGVTRADAVDQALSDLAIANNTTEANILAQIGTTETALRADITDVGASVEALAETVGQDTQYDDQGNVVTEATGIFAEFDNLIDQGANEYQALTTAISNVSDQVGTTEETLFGAIQDSENRLSNIIGSPSISDDPNTPEDETIPATGIYADIEQSTSDISSAVGSAIGGMGGFEKFMGGFDYSPAQFVAVEYQPPKDYMVELDRMIDEGFKDVFNDRQNSMFGDMI